MLLSVQAKSEPRKIAEIGFRSISDGTNLVIKSDLSSGRYRSTFEGEKIYGDFTIYEEESWAKRKVLQAEFIEPASNCRGDLLIDIRRQSNPVRYDATATWSIFDPDFFQNCGVSQVTTFKSSVKRVAANSRSQWRLLPRARQYFNQ